MALSPIMNIMIKTAERAGRSLARDFGEVEQLQVSRKGPGDFVSAADLRSEEIIHYELSKARPDYSFLMEERGQVGEKDAEYTWVVDPLDGTTNFLHGIPHWNISIALMHKGEVQAGIVFDPIKDELFRAEKGKGAFVRNKRLRVSGRTKLEESAIAAGGIGHLKDEQKALFRPQLAAMNAVCPGVRRFGAAALDLAYVAAGRVEAFWEYNINAWDIAAGSIIIKESGGIISEITGNGDPIKSGNVLATNSNLSGEIRELLKKASQKKNAA